MKKSLLNLRSTLLVGVAMTGMYVNSQCTITNHPPNPNTTSNNGTYDYVQSFTAPCSGNMQYFELTATEAGTLPGATLYVYNGNVSSGTAIYTQAYPNITSAGAGSPLTINITGTLPLVSGNQYSFRFEATTQNFHFTTGSQYAGGHIWQNGSPLTSTDFYFEIQIGNGCAASSIAPDLASLPSLTDQCSVIAPTAPTATNNCGTIVDGVPSVTFPISVQGTTQVIWSYDDGAGNTTTQTQDVVIADVTDPVPDVAQLPTVTESCELIALTPPTATDNCAGVITATTTTSFPISTQGTTQITWIYDDGSGNTVTQTQDVVIADVTAPVPDLAQLPDLTNQCEATSLVAPTATDDCGGTITATTTTTAPIATLGNSMITWTFDDGNGNTSTQTQNVVNPTIDNTVTVTGTTLQANQTVAAYQWVDCDAAFAPISGEVNQSYTPSVTGNYAVEINVQGCVDTSACELIDYTGIEELTNAEKELVKIVDLLGRETEFKPNMPLIFIYSDGTMERVMEVKY